MAGKGRASRFSCVRTCPERHLPDSPAELPISSHAVGRSDSELELRKRPDKKPELRGPLSSPFPLLSTDFGEVPGRPDSGRSRRRRTSPAKPRVEHHNSQDTALCRCRQACLLPRNERAPAGKSRVQIVDHRRPRFSAGMTSLRPASSHQEVVGEEIGEPDMGEKGSLSHSPVSPRSESW